MKSDAFRAAAEAKDFSAIEELFAEDVSFRSPVVFKPYQGREAVAMLLSAVVQVFEDFRYTDQTETGDSAALAFSARVGDSGAACFRHQSAIFAREQRRDQGIQRGFPCVLIQDVKTGLLQRARIAGGLEEVARRFCVLDDESIELAHHGERGRRQGIERGPFVQRNGYQVQRSCVGRHGAAQTMATPSFLSMAASRIRGRPIKALGSSLTTRSTSTMPSPSILALPAQS